MKRAEEMDRTKIRGGFYTPTDLVQLCIHRVEPTLYQGSLLRVLEPSCGDGAFIRGLAASSLGTNVQEFVGVEIDTLESRRSHDELCRSGFRGSVVNDDAVQFLAERREEFDLALGNPPFVRYQYARTTISGQLESIAKRLGVKLMGVSNLWIPIFMGAVNLLRNGGAFSFVLPSEVLTGVSAGLVREWLLRNTSGLILDLFPPKSFPEVLQEVVVISGVKALPRTPRMHFVQHFPDGSEHRWTHFAAQGNMNWTRYLLKPVHLEGLSLIEDSRSFRRLGEVAKLEVSVVTGANDFFTVADDEVTQFDLEGQLWPLVPRLRCVAGLEMTTTDFANMRARGGKSWLVDLNGATQETLNRHGIINYLELGKALEIHRRYKTKIRKPWFGIPSIWAGELLLSKRSHDFPRLVLNSAKVVTTDTIYRGRMQPEFKGKAIQLVSGFHNSATMLSAEIEGRSFGGGVLELVPSELARILVPLPRVDRRCFDQLDTLHRQQGADKLLENTDQIVKEDVDPQVRELWHVISDAHRLLQERRFSRN